MRKLKFFLSLLMLFCFSLGTVFADSYTITFKSTGTSSDGSSGLTSTTIDDYVSDGAAYISAISASGKVYNGQSDYGLKFGNSSNPGSVTLTLATAVKPDSIVMSASPWGATEGSGLLQDSTIDLTVTGAKGTFGNFVYRYDGKTSISSIIVGTKTKRGYVKNVTIYYEPTDPTIVVKKDDEALTSIDFGNVGQRFQKSFVFDLQAKNMEAGTLTMTLSGDDVFAFSGGEKTSTISMSAGNSTTFYLSFYQNTQEVGDYNGTLTFTGCGLPTAGISIPITMSVKAPEITTSVSSVDFGHLKQDDQGVWSNPTSITLTAHYLKSGIRIAAYGSMFDVIEHSTETYYVYPNEDGDIEATIDVIAALGWSGSMSSHLIISSLASPLTEFDQISDMVTFSSVIDPAYKVRFKVYDYRGTITVNGVESDDDGYVYTYVEDGDEAITIVANPKLGWEFAEWQVDNADKDNVTITDKNAASTTVKSTAATSNIIAMFVKGCNALSFPYYPGYIDGEVYYNRANLQWNWVTYDDDSKVATYTVKMKEKDTENVISRDVAFTSAELAESEAHYTFTGLQANTTYQFYVYATTTEDGYCATGEESTTIEFTTPDYPAATLTLSENGVERAFAGSHKVADVITLPTEVETGVVGKTLVGWSTLIVATTDVKPSANFYEAGANYTIASTDDKLYAVFAAGHGDIDEWRVATSVKAGDVVVFSTNTDYTANPMQTAGAFSGTNTYTSVTNSTYSTDQKTITALAANTLQFTIGGNATDGWTLQNGTKYLAMTGDKKIALIDNDSTWIITFDGEVATVSEYFTGQSATYSIKYNYNNGNPRFTGYKSGQVDISLFKHYTESANWSGYATSGPRQLSDPMFSPAAGTYTTAQNISITAAEGDIYYTLDGTDPTSTSTAYSSAIALDTYGTHTIKAIAIDGDNCSEVVSATYMINLPFASLAEMMTTIGANAATDVTVTLTDVEIEDFNSNRKAVYLVDKGPNNNSAELYNANTACPDWEAGGTLSGTITADWTLFGNNWELTNVDWTALSYKAPAGIAWSAETGTGYMPTGAKEAVLPTLANPKDLAVTYHSSNTYAAQIDAEGNVTIKGAGTTVISATASNEYAGNVVSYTLTVLAPSAKTVGGELTKSAYEFGETYDPAGLTFVLQYEDETSWSTSEGVTFTFYPSTVTNAQVSKTTVEVSAEWNDLNTSAVEVNATVLKHAVTFAAPENGTIWLSSGGAAVNSGDKLLKGKYVIVDTYPAAHYALDKITVNGEVIPYNGFTIGTEDVEVVVTFKRAESAVTMSAEHGSFTLMNGAAEVSYGQYIATGTALTVTDFAPESINYKFGSIVVKKAAEPYEDVTAEVLSGTTITMPEYDINVKVVFEAKLAPGLGWRYGGEDVTTHAHTYGASTERFYFPSLKNPNEIDLDDIEFISSDSTVAEFGARSHEYSSWFAAVWVKKAGTAVMTARLKNHATYDDIEVSYTLTVSKGDLTSSQFRWSQYPDIENPETDTYTWYESNHSYPYVNASASYVDKNTEVTYESTDESVATISSTGSITPVANGSTTIKAKFIGNDKFNAKTIQFTLNVQKASPVLSWSSAPTSSNTTVDLANSYGLYTFPRFGSVSPYVDALKDLVVLSSSDPTVAEINSNGYVNPLAVGTTTIKLSLAATDKSNAAEELSYTFTVTDSRPELTIVAGDHGTYQVKDNSNTYVIESGSKIKANTNLYLVSLSAETGYKNTPTYKVVKTSDNTDVTSDAINGSYLKMQAFDITISATYPEKAVAPIGWSSTETQYAYTDDRAYTLPTFINAGLSITFASSNPSVATVSNGQVTVLSAGTTNISVSYAGDENYKQTTVSYELVVRSPNHLNVKGQPTKLMYDYGESINFTGMTATLYYSEDNSDGVDVTDVANWSSNPATVTASGQMTLTASYKGKEGSRLEYIYLKQYEVTFSNLANAHGTIVVKNNGTAISSHDAFPKGTVLTVEATPDAGYKLSTLTANGDDIMATKQFTIGTEEVTIAATFTVALIGGECGKQGDNLLWQYNPTTKVLTITGSGEMADYTHSYSDGSNTTPWDQYRNDITSVVLPNGITSIGNWAFGNFKALTAITLPNTITVLGESAFNYSTALVSINMPTQLQTLGKMAFFNTRITSLTIPASVTSIGQQIVGAVTTLTAISVEAGNTVYDSRNNCNAIIRKSDNVLIVGCKNSTIPSDITGIADWAFDRGYAPATVELPAGVTSIGEHAFYYGRAITLLRIPVGVTSISSQAFSSAFDADGADVYVEWTTPLVVFDDIVVATNVANATLHVPYGTKSLYEAANGWKNFGTIVEADKPTGLDDAMVSGDSQVRKVIIDSKLFIIRGDKMFDAQGKLVK